MSSNSRSTCPEEDGSHPDVKLTFAPYKRHSLDYFRHKVEEDTSLSKIILGKRKFEYSTSNYGSTHSTPVILGNRDSLFMAR